MEGKLTARQENFCLAYIENGSGANAYRAAYSAKNMKPATIHRRAFDLLENGKIQARLAELRQPAIDKAQVTLEQHLEDLKVLRDKASEDGKYSAAIQAEVARGKAAGLYRDKIEVSGKEGKDLVVKHGLGYFYGEGLQEKELTPQEAYEIMCRA